MQDLQLVGVHDDGEHVLLAAADGQRYRLHIDDPLRAAVRRDRARLGQLQIEIDGGMRPKDIQARIRAGATAEEVADASGLAVEHVRRYEGPVLAEREHVCELARRLPVRRRDGSGRSPQLEILVDERLAARGVTDGTAWDAWRRDDTTWTVELTFRAGSKERRAQWAFDLARSTVEALDDESRWLSAVEGQESGPIPGRRLSAVKERVYDVEADGGVREARRRGGRSPVPAAPDPHATSPSADEDPPAPEVEAADEGRREAPAALGLLDALKGRRGRRSPVLGPDEIEAAEAAEAAEAQEMRDREAQGDDAEGREVPAAHPPTSRPDEALDAEILDLPEEPETVGARRITRDEGGKPRAKRASVPSWDEIVFGAKRD